MSREHSLRATAVPKRAAVLKRTHKQQHILDRLALELVDDRLRSGHTLTLDSLQSRFSVSRTVIRDVAQVLQSLGMLEARRRVGLIVQPRSRWSLLDPQVIAWQLESKQRHKHFVDLTQLRIAIEPLAASTAALRMREPQKQELCELERELNEYGTQGELDKFLAADQAYHAAILRGSDNQLFASLTDVVSEVLAERTRQGLMPHKPEAAALALHHAVVLNISEADAASAERNMRALLDEVRESMGW